MLFREQREYKVLALTSGHGSYLLMACCVALGKSLALSELPFSHQFICYFLGTSPGPAGIPDGTQTDRQALPS